jgi:4-hydroxy-tetrahydrodipicolinate synthase
MTRRDLLILAAAASVPGRSAPAKPLRGIFPIMQSPFTDSDALDLESLGREVRFLDRCGAHGAVWPQLASEWDTLTESERLEGAEAVAAAAKGLKLAILLGVQSPSVDTAVKYAKQAGRLGADAIISLPPPSNIVEYYAEVGRATSLPLFVQAVGKMSPELLLEMTKKIPTFHYVKDEAGKPLDRIGQLKEAQLQVFSGNHGKTLIEEMRRGFSGSMPAAAFADLYAQTWDLWQSGKRREAMDMHARTLLVLTDMGLYGFEGLKYPLVLRGVFRTWKIRKKEETKLTEAGMRALREALDFAKPYLRA